jgi:hypothetical protein
MSHEEYITLFINQGSTTNQVTLKPTTKTSGIWKDDDKIYTATFVNETEFSLKLTVAGGARKKTKFTKSTERVTINGRARVVYMGLRGGRYILSKGEYVSLAKLRG